MSLETFIPFEDILNAPLYAKVPETPMLANYQGVPLRL